MVIKILQQRGFTIVELLIVVVVIAILAAITIVAYNGITRAAAESSLKSDLRNSAQLVEKTKEESGTSLYPATSAEATLAQSPGSTVTYLKKPYGYCIAGVNPKTNKTFAIRSVSKKIEEGTCDVTVTTLAGTNTSGYTDGTGTAARFAGPSGVAAANDGTVYVSDTSNNRIRKISTDGTVSFVSGTGASGSVNSTAAASQYNQPGKLTFDTSGNLYVVEGSRNTVRKVNASTGDSTAYAGTSAVCNFGRGSFTDGDMTNARLDGPSSIATDNSGVSYIAENRSNRIRAVQTDGSVSTYAGSGALNSCVASSADAGSANGSRLSASFSSPQSIVIDNSGVLYIGDSGNNAIRTISTGGVVGSLISSLGSNQLPRSMVIDSQGTIYSASNYGVFSITPSGTIALVAGSNTVFGFVNGSATTARFNIINDISFNADQTALFVADSQNHSIRKISL